MSEKKKPLRWRKVVYKVFLRRECRYELRRGEEVLASVRLGSRGWYWTAEGHPAPTFPERNDSTTCKEAARAAVLAWESAGCPEEGR